MSPRSLTGALAAAIALAVLAPPAAAQTTVVVPVAEVRTPEITVLAPRITYGRDRTARAEVAHQQALVDTSDLDLRRTADWYVLQDRIDAAAINVCNELAELYPHGSPSTDVCVRRAVDDAMALARHVVRTDGLAVIDDD